MLLHQNWRIIMLDSTKIELLSMQLERKDKEIEALEREVNKLKGLAELRKIGSLNPVPFFERA